MALELNGNTKVVFRLAEVFAIFGALIWFGWNANRLNNALDSAVREIKAVRVDLSVHCRSDWTLQHEVLMASRVKASNPDARFVWPSPVEVHDDLRRSTE